MIGNKLVILCLQELLIVTEEQGWPSFKLEVCGATFAHSSQKNVNS